MDIHQETLKEVKDVKEIVIRVDERTLGFGKRIWRLEVGAVTVLASIVLLLLGFL